MFYNSGSINKKGFKIPFYFLIRKFSFLKMKILHFEKRKFIIFKNEMGRKRENEKRQIEKWQKKFFKKVLDK